MHAIPGDLVQGFAGCSGVLIFPCAQKKEHGADSQARMPWHMKGTRGVKGRGVSDWLCQMLG